MKRKKERSDFKFKESNSITNTIKLLNTKIFYPNILKVGIGLK